MAASEHECIEAVTQALPEMTALVFVMDTPTWRNEFIPIKLQMHTGPSES